MHPSYARSQPTSPPELYEFSLVKGGARVLRTEPTIRLSSPSVLPGRSAAPARLLTDDRVAGVVSARCKNRTYVGGKPVFAA